MLNRICLGANIASVILNSIGAARAQSLVTFLISSLAVILCSVGVVLCASSLSRETRQ